MVAIYDAEATERGIAIAMEYVEGSSLRAWLAHECSSATTRLERCDRPRACDRLRPRAHRDRRDIPGCRRYREGAEAALIVIEELLRSSEAARQWVQYDKRYRAWILPVPANARATAKVLVQEQELRLALSRAGWEEHEGLHW